MPTGSPCPVRAGCTLRILSSRAPWPHSAEMLHFVQHDMYRTAVRYAVSAWHGSLTARDIRSASDPGLQNGAM